MRSPSLYKRSGNGTFRPAPPSGPARAIRGPRPTRGLNVHSSVSVSLALARISSHFSHSFVLGVDNRAMRSSPLATSSALFALRGREIVRGLKVSSFCSSARARAAMASFECRPAFCALRLNGAGTPGSCRGRSRGAELGRTALRPAKAAALAGVMNPREGGEGRDFGADGGAAAERRGADAGAPRGDRPPGEAPTPRFTAEEAPESLC